MRRQIDLLEKGEIETASEWKSKIAFEQALTVWELLKEGEGKGLSHGLLQAYIALQCVGRKEIQFLGRYFTDFPIGQSHPSRSRVSDKEVHVLLGKPHVDDIWDKWSSEQKEKLKCFVKESTKMLIASITNFASEDEILVVS